MSALAIILGVVMVICVLIIIGLIATINSACNTLVSFAEGIRPPKMEEKKKKCWFLHSWTPWKLLPHSNIHKRICCNCNTSDYEVI